MNWHRTLQITLFDLRWAIFRRKGLMFILPYCLFWYLILKQFYEGAANWIQSSEIMMLASTRFDIEMISHLFVELPPSMSAFFILALYMTPFFTMLAANDLFASDLGSGYFRFLVTRCHRVEIFLARCLSALLIITVCTIITATAAALIATFIEGYTVRVVTTYLLRIIPILLLYSTPYLACMAIVSAMLNSPIVVILLASAGYTVLLICISIADVAFDEPVIFSYLVPSGIKKDLISLDHADLLMAIAVTPAYTLIFAWLAWAIFKRRNF
jgi:hypothetical protein